MENLEKQICKEIRKVSPIWESKDDVFINNYCDGLTLITILICNEGYSIKDAVKKIII